MKTYQIDHYGPVTVALSIGAYQGMPHCDSPLAIEVLSPCDDEDEFFDPGKDGEEMPLELYGTLTTNLDPYTGEKKQAENRAFVKLHAENDPWAKQLLDQLVAEGIAKYTGKIGLDAAFQSYPLVEFDLEKLKDIAVPAYEE